MNKSIKYLFFTIFPLSILNAQPDLSGRVTFPDSVGIDLIRIEVWQNNQQITNTITDSLGYFAIDSIITGLDNSNSISPSSFELYPNYPSPFDKKTNIIYEVNEPKEISITIYNSIGQKITTLTSGYRQKGFYVAQWNGRNNFGNEVAQGIYFARLDNGKDAKSIKLLKMNGALNAIGTTIPGGFYTSYKGREVNEDYLIKFIDINIFNKVDYAEITISLPAEIHQVLTEAFSYAGPSQIAGVEGEQVAVSKNWFNYGTQLDTIELINTNVWTFINFTQDTLYFATIDSTLNGQIPLELKTIALHSTADTTDLNIYLTAETYLVYGFVTTPNGMPLDSMDVAAYDTLGNFLNRDITVQDGSFEIDSIPAITIDLIFNDLKNRTNSETLRVVIPAEVNKILQETYAGYQGQNPQGEEGREIGVAKADFPYNTGLDSLILVNNNIWYFVRSSVDSIFYATNDTTVNGQIPLILNATAIGGTTNQEDIQTNLTDMITWQGQFLDDMKYKKLLNIIEPGAGIKGVINVAGENYETDELGNFTIRLPATTEYTVMVRGINDLLEPTTYIHTSQEEGTDQNNLILHAMPYWPLTQMELTPQDGYDFAWEGNFRPGAGSNVTGLKRIHLDTGEHWIARVHPSVGDTMTVEEQNYLASVIEDSLNSRMQTPLSIYLATLQDTVPVSRRNGVELWSVRRNGPAGTISVFDENLDGLLDFNDLKVTAGTPQHLGTILQEGASGIFGPWPVYNENFFGKTVIHEGGGNPGYITLADDWLLRLIENYDNLQNIDNILGGASAYSYMKNVTLLNSLMDRIELESKKKNPSQENFNRYSQEFIKKVQQNINQ